MSIIKEAFIRQMVLNALGEHKGVYVNLNAIWTVYTMRVFLSNFEKDVTKKLHCSQRELKPILEKLVKEGIIAKNDYGWYSIPMV